MLRVFLFISVVFTCIAPANAGQNYLPPLPHQAALIKGLQVIDQGQWSVGESFISKASGTLSGQVFYWLRYTSDAQAKDADWYRISRFILSHHDWPDLKSMQRNAEKVMPANLSHTEVIKWFDRFSPVTADAKIRYLDALLLAGRQDRFQKVLIEYWVGHLFGAEAQRKFLDKYGSSLSRRVHQKRLSFLLGRGYYDTALDLSSRAGSGYRSLVIAAKALSKSQKNVTGLINAVPSSLQSHSALVYERIRWRRKKNMNDGAISLLLSAPSMTKEMNQYAWWKERHILIRRLLEEKDYAGAFRLASHHKQKSGLGLSEAEFLSGWLALRFLDKPHQAYQHFQILFRNVKTPISKSRGAYWAGRAAVATNQYSNASKWFKAAAYWHTTFYGQHAYRSLQGLKRQGKIAASEVLTVPSAVTVSDVTWDRWINDNRVTVMRVLYEAGLEDRALQFVARMSGDKGNTKEDFMALAKIVRLMDYKMGEVKLAKKAAYNAVLLITEDKDVLGYPTIEGSADYDHISLSHVHAIIRQESEFNQDVTSPAGAKGYMQLMPATAKQVARELKIKHRTSWLTLRAEHNIRLGSTYLDSLMDQYDGNLILSAAAYNAGPHRVKTWMSRMGDPRKGGVDLIDWIEFIPFSETRNYVQRVTEAEYVYSRKFAN